MDRELRYRPVNPSLEYRDESEGPLIWSIRILDVLGYQSQFIPLADLLAQSIGDLPPPTERFPSEFPASGPRRRIEEACPPAQAGRAQRSEPTRKLEPRGEAARASLVWPRGTGLGQVLSAP